MITKLHWSIVHMKSEGVKDIVKWLEEQCKEAKKDMLQAKEDKRQFGIFEDCGEFYETEYLLAEKKLETLVQVKISTEKYMKKLRHQGE